MTLSQLTEAEKNRWIAEKLGWQEDDDLCCPGKIPDFHNDPAMRDLLQERLLAMGYDITLTADFYQMKPGEVLLTLTARTGPDITAEGSRESAWPDAFMLASGWKEE